MIKTYTMDKQIVVETTCCAQWLSKKQAEYLVAQLQLHIDFLKKEEEVYNA